MIGSVFVVEMFLADACGNEPLYMSLWVYVTCHDRLCRFHVALWTLPSSKALLNTKPSGVPMFASDDTEAY